MKHHVPNNDASFHSPFHPPHRVAQHLGTKCPSHSSPVLQPWTQRPPHPCQFCTCPLRKKHIRLSCSCHPCLSYFKLSIQILSNGSIIQQVGTCDEHAMSKLCGISEVKLVLCLICHFQVKPMSNGSSTGCHGTDLTGRLVKMVKQIWHEVKSTCLFAFLPL